MEAFSKLQEKGTAEELNLYRFAQSLTAPTTPPTHATAPTTATAIPTSAVTKARAPKAASKAPASDDEAQSDDDTMFAFDGYVGVRILARAAQLRCYASACSYQIEQK